MFSVPGNNLRLVLNNDYVTAVINQLEYLLRRKLGKYESEMVTRTIENEDPRMYAYYPEAAFKVLVDKLYEQITKPCDEEPIDMREVMKSMINGELAPDDQPPPVSLVNVDSIMGYNSLDFVAQRIALAQSTKTVCIMLDSRYRSLNTDGSLEFQWTFIDSENVADGSVNVVGNVRDIVAIRVSPIRIPYTIYADNSYKRITMLIKELSSQSIVNHETNRHHFLFKPHIDGRFIELQTENFRDGKFKFRKPFTKLERLTLTFGSPLGPVPFDLDRATATITDYDIITTFSTGLIPHNLETGDTVYIYTFTTLNPNSDLQLIQQIINSNGQTATVVDLVTFTININTESLLFIGPGTISVVFLSKFITGSGTTFTSLFRAGDTIQIAGVKYSISSVISNTSIQLTTAYLGPTLIGLPYIRSNIIPGYTTTVFFGSKRFFVELELEYLNTEEVIQ